MKDMDLQVQSVLQQPFVEMSRKLFLSIKETGELLGTTPRMIHRLIADGRLFGVNLSIRKMVIPRSEIDRLFLVSETSAARARSEQTRPDLKECYSISEAQRVFSISEKALYDLIKRNNLAKFNIGKHSYVSKKDLKRIFNPTLK